MFWNKLTCHHDCHKSKVRTLQSYLCTRESLKPMKTIGHLTIFCRLMKAKNNLKTYESQDY